MNKKGILACLLVLVVIIEEGQTAHTTIPVLKVKAEREVYSILQEILELESYTVRHHRQAHAHIYLVHNIYTVYVAFLQLQLTISVFFNSIRYTIYPTRAVTCDLNLPIKL